MSLHHPASVPSSPYTNSTPHLDPSLNPHFSLSARPTCPSILIPFEGQLYALPIYTLNIVAEFNVSTAFIKITGTWKNIANYTSDCMFVLPLNGTVTECTIGIESRIFETIIIPTDEAMKMKQEMEESGMGMSGFAYGSVDHNGNNPNAEGQLPQGQLPPMSYEEYIPNLFRLPIAAVASTDMITVTCIYIEPLPFINSSYNFTLPLSFGPNLIPPGKTMNDILSITAIINSVTPHTRYECTSHQLKVVKEDWPRLELAVMEFDQQKNQEKLAAIREKEKNRLNNPNNNAARSSDLTGLDNNGNADEEYFANASVDFQLAYSMTTDHILPTLIKEPTLVSHRSQEEREGNFLLFVTPPSIENVNIFFARNLVFLLDRSGSMNGDPYHEATRALTVALSNLKPADQFTIVAFDHRQEVFSHELVPVNHSNIAAAATWIKTIQPQKGGTDIQTPLEWALDLLQVSNSSHTTLPFVILLTDGCVSNEREICKFTARTLRTTRILTFGIGSYCNWFFLKMLAQIGRGFSDVVVYREKIYSQMLQLLNMCAVPVITDLRLEMTGGLRQVELYPFPIPDLFMGAPLTISGKYVGRLPEEVTLVGLKADKSVFRMGIRPRTSDVIPVNRVFIKQRLDLLTARAWLEESKKLQQEVIELSCNESMPSAFTMMVAYETTEERKAKVDQELAALEREEYGENGDEKRNGDGDSSRAEIDDGDVDEDGHPKKRPPLPSEINRRKLRRWYRNKKVIGALAVGNLMVIGAAAFSFGDVGGTLGNIPVIGDVFGAFDGGCCEHCHECDCTCIHECLPC